MGTIESPSVPPLDTHSQSDTSDSLTMILHLLYCDMCPLDKHTLYMMRYPMDNNIRLDSQLAHPQPHPNLDNTFLPHTADMCFVLPLIVFQAHTVAVLLFPVCRMFQPDTVRIVLLHFALDQDWKQTHQLGRNGPFHIIPVAVSIHCSHNTILQCTEHICSLTPRLN